MPLYEMIVLSKCTNAQQAATLMAKITKILWSHGGTVRDVKILSDRLLAKEARAVDGHRSNIGRFTQVLFDGSPYLMEKVRKQISFDKNIFKISFFKIKDFYNYAQQYTKEQTVSQINTVDKKMQTARKIAILKQQGGL